MPVEHLIEVLAHLRFTPIVRHRRLPSAVAAQL
jgi:hypothetical protein